MARAMLNSVDSLRFREWVNECELPTFEEEERRGQDDSDQVKQIRHVESGVSISAYPNPLMDGDLVVDVIENEPLVMHSFSYRILNTIGASISTGRLQTGKNRISATNLTNGLNLIRILDSYGRSVAHFKITVVK
jgi:hypothetical protein